MYCRETKLFVMIRIILSISVVVMCVCVFYLLANLLFPERISPPG